MRRSNGKKHPSTGRVCPWASCSDCPLAVFAEAESRYFVGIGKFCVEEATPEAFHRVFPPMFTQARPPVREARLLCQAPARAFTLIELLTVISIIAILSAISLNVIKGVKERSSVGQAKAELASLSQALEMYKLQYGDYPQTGMTADAVTVAATSLSSSNVQYRFFNALAGKYGPTLAQLTSSKCFVDLARFTLLSTAAADMPTPTGNTLVSNALLDPWGQTYIYYYKTAGSATWTSPTYVLFSVGPDGLKADTDISSAGVVNFDPSAMDPKNLDNIYANH